MSLRTQKRFPLNRDHGVRLANADGRWKCASVLPKVLRVFIKISMYVFGGFKAVGQLVMRSNRGKRRDRPAVESFQRTYVIRSANPSTDTSVWN